MAKNKQGGGRVRSDIPYKDRLLMAKFTTVAEHRDHAALNDTEGMGYFRLARFAKRQQALTEEYYSDPEYMEAKLNQRLVQLGFKIVDGRLFGAVDEEGNTVSTKNLEVNDG